MTATTKAATSIPLYQAMSTLRAVRRLKPDPIPDDVLKRILQAAAWAPSGGNTQPWRIVAVRDARLRSQIGDLYRRQWQKYAQASRGKLERLQGESQEKYRRILAAGDYLGDNMGSAPVLLVACFNPSIMAITDADLGRPSVVGGGSVYPAMENLMLACVNEGIGCTLTTLLCFEEEAMKEILALPEQWHSCGVIPIGYPQGKGHGPITRAAVETLVFEDTFGQSLSLD